MFEDMMRDHFKGLILLEVFGLVGLLAVVGALGFGLYELVTFLIGLLNHNG